MRYLDYNATAPLIEPCARVVTEWAQQSFHGNPNTSYGLGRNAREHIDLARRQVAKSLGARPSQVVFFPSASSALLRGLEEAFYEKWEDGEIPVVAAQRGLHDALHLPLEQWEKQGRIRVIWIPLQANGTWRVEDFISQEQRSLDLLVVAHGQHETGLLFPIQELREAMPRIPLLVDAVQSYGKVPLLQREMGAQWLVISGHKVGALPGVGALVRCPEGRGGVVSPLSAHEGTENTLAIVTLGVASACIEERVSHYEKIRELTAVLESALEKMGNVQVMGKGQPRLPNTVYALFSDMDGEEIQDALDRLGICVGTGAACAQRTKTPSRTLRAMGVSSRDLFGAIRFSLGPLESPEELGEVIQCLEHWIPRLREGEFPKREEPC